MAEEQPIFNVWLSLEEIKEESEDNGNDLRTEKLRQFTNEKDANEFFVEICNKIGITNKKKLAIQSKAEKL